MNGPWWAAQSPAEAAVTCGPNRHRLRWEQGRLLALDHADADGEAVLAALGGAEPACVNRLQQWEAHAADPRVLFLASRHPGDNAAPTASALEVAAREVEQLRQQGRDAQVSDAVTHLGLLELLALDAPLVRRLQQQVAAALAAREGDRSALAAVEAATVGRLRPALRRWRPERRFEVVLGEPGIDDGAVVTVSVGPAWLSEVWGPYLTVVGGWLVLDVHDAGPSHAEVTAVPGPGGRPERLSLRGPAPWRVA